MNFYLAWLNQWQCEMGVLKEENDVEIIEGPTIEIEKDPSGQPCLIYTHIFPL